MRLSKPTQCSLGHDWSMTWTEFKTNFFLSYYWAKVGFFFLSCQRSFSYSLFWFTSNWRASTQTFFKKDQLWGKVWTWKARCRKRNFSKVLSESQVDNFKLLHFAGRDLNFYLFSITEIHESVFAPFGDWPGSDCIMHGGGDGGCIYCFYSSALCVTHSCKSSQPASEVVARVFLCMGWQWNE